MTAESAQIQLSCPSCNSAGYEVEFDAREMSGGTQISFPCDDCNVRIAVDLTVYVQAVKR